jgi:hypothetical protein
MYDKDKRAAAQDVRELLMEATLGQQNKCDFDLTQQERSILLRKKLNEPKAT